MIVNILSVSAMMAFLAVVGPVVRGLGMQEWHIGVTVALGGVAWILFSRIWGRRSDVKGRKPVLMAGIAGFAVFYLVLAVYIDAALASPPAAVISLLILMFTRGMIGLFYSAVQPVCAAMVADKVNPADRSSYMARLGAANGLGMIVGPVYGGMLAMLGLAVPLYASAILPLAALVLLYFTLPSEPPVSTSGDEILKIMDKRLRLPMSAAFFTMYSVVTSQVCTGFFVLDRLGLDAVSASKVTGYTLSAIGIVFVAIQIVVSKFKSTTPEAWMKMGSLIAFAGMAIVSVMHSQFVLMVGFCIASAGMGMLFPAFQAMTANSVTMKEQGAAAGTVSAVQGIGIIVAPLGSTFLYELDPMYPFIAAAVSFAFLAVIAFRHVQAETAPEAV